MIVRPLVLGDVNGRHLIGGLSASQAEVVALAHGNGAAGTFD